MKTDINFVHVQCSKQENAGEWSGTYENNKPCEAWELLKKGFLTTILLDPDHSDPTA